jgi:hypothetical protein
LVLGTAPARLLLRSATQGRIGERMSATHSPDTQVKESDATRPENGATSDATEKAAVADGGGAPSDEPVETGETAGTEEQ